MNTTKIFRTTVAASIALVISSSAFAQWPGTKRVNLLQGDIVSTGREVIQARIDLAPGVLAPKHSHPGEEIVYVLEGSFVYEIEGREPVTLKAGDVLFIPAGAVHSAKNIGKVNAAELATYIVEKGKPLVRTQEDHTPGNKNSNK